MSTQEARAMKVRDLLNLLLTAPAGKQRFPVCLELCGSIIPVRRLEVTEVTHSYPDGSAFVPGGELDKGETLATFEEPVLLLTFFAAAQGDDLMRYVDLEQQLSFLDIEYYGCQLHIESGEFYFEKIHEGLVSFAAQAQIPNRIPKGVLILSLNGVSIPSRE